MQIRTLGTNSTAGRAGWPYVIPLLRGAPVVPGATELNPANHKCALA